MTLLFPGVGTRWNTVPLQCHVIVFKLVKYNVNRARVFLNKAVFSVFSKPTNCREDQSNPVSRLVSPVSISWWIPSSETRVSDRRAAHYVPVKLNDSDGEISRQPKIFKQRLLFCSRQTVLVKSSNAQCTSKICSTYLNLSIFITDATLSLRSSWVRANSSWQQASEWNLIIVAELVQREGPDLQPSDNNTIIHSHTEFFFFNAAMLPNVYVFHATKADHAIAFFALTPWSIIKTLWTSTVRVAGRDMPYVTW